MKTRILSALLVLCAATAPAFAASDNLEMFRKVEKQVLQYPHFTIFDSVNTEIDGSVVRLTGKVTMPFKKNDIAKRAGSVSGVREVLNRIDVLPVSPYDDDLRQRIARAIYGNSAFWQYGAMANPPIHIIVERGHVTLTGVVNSNVDRMLARSLAIGFGELSVTNDLRTDAEMRSN